MKGYLADSFVQTYMRNRHDMKKIQKYFEFSDFDDLKELEGEKKWWLICKDHIDFIFDTLDELKHRFPLSLLKQYAQIMYDSLFTLKFAPNSALLLYDGSNKEMFPSCPIVEMNLEKIGSESTTTTFNNSLFTILLYARVVSKYASKIEPVNKCGIVGEHIITPLFDYYNSLEEGETKSRLYNLNRWILNIDQKLNSYLGEGKSNIYPAVIHSKDSINLLFLRKI